MDYAAARKNMVDCQILPTQVTDPLVIDAMYSVPREAFVPKQLQSIAYVDEALSLGEGRYLAEPIILARLFQAAEISETDVVLDIGCGTGYAAAILAKIAGTVVGLESDKALAEAASAALSAQGADNAVVIEGDLTKGNAENGPYDVIFINGAVGEIPEAILQQLADGGRLITIVEGEEAVGRAQLVVRDGDSFSHRDLFDAGTPLLPGFEASKPGFVF